VILGTNMRAMVEVPVVVEVLVAVLLLPTTLALPFRGWGPGEGYGNAGRRPPAGNPNAAFGYDRFGLTRDKYNYSAIVLQHSVASMLLDAKYVAMVPAVPRARRHRHHGGHQGTVEVPMFIEAHPSSSRGQQTRKKSSGPVRKQSKPKAKLNQKKRQRSRGKLRTAPSKRVSSLPPRKGRRSRKQAPPLTAGDLWSLNGSAKNFQELRKRGRRRKKGRRFQSWSERRRAG